MSDAWGDSTTHYRAGISAWVTSTTDTTATIRVQAIWQSLAWGFNVPSGNQAFCDCDGTDNPWVSVGGVYSSTGETRSIVLREQDFTVSRPQGTSGRWVRCGAGVYVPGYAAGGATKCRAYCDVWVDPRAYGRPRKPASFAARRASDAAQDLTWAGDYTGLDGYYPWTGVYVDRAVDGGPWQTIATLSWSATNYRDASTSAGHRYDYRLRSYGPGGTSDATATATLYTTPGAYGSVVASKPTATSVRLTPGTSPAYATGQAFQSSTDGGSTWEDAEFSDWVCADPPRGTVTFRVAATIMSGGTGSTLLQGPWAQSNGVATLCAPDAPALGNLPQVVATGSSLSVSWSPNHPDGSAQSEAQVEVTVGDGAATTHDVDGAATSYGLPSSATSSAATVRVRVRTHGDYDGWGEWSSYATVRVAVAPVLVLTSPADGGRLARLPMAVSWEFDDATGRVAQTLEVSSGGSVLLSRDLGASPDSVELSSADMRFDNGASYAVTLAATAGSGLAATAAATVTVDWDLPSLPEVDVAAGEGLSAVVSVTASDVEPVAASFSVARVDPDGTRTPLASGLLSGQQAIDRLPPLNVALTYEVTGTAASGTTSTLDVPFVVDAPGMALNAGLAAEEAWEASLDPDLTEDVSRASTTVHLFDGSDLPQVYSSGEVDGSVSCSFSVTEDGWQALAAMLRAHAYGWLRGHDGQRWFGAVSGSSSRLLDGWRTARISLSQCSWREPNV